MKYIIFGCCCMSAFISALLLCAVLASGFLGRSDIEINIGVIASTGLFMLILSIMAALRQWRLRSADIVILPIVLGGALGLAFTAATTHTASVSNWFGAAHIAISIAGMLLLHRRNATDGKRSSNISE